MTNKLALPKVPMERFSARVHQWTLILQEHNISNRFLLIVKVFILYESSICCTTYEEKTPVY